MNGNGITNRTLPEASSSYLVPWDCDRRVGFEVMLVGFSILVYSNDGNVSK